MSTRTKRIKSVFSIMLAVATVLSCLTACKGGDDFGQGDYHETTSAEGKNEKETTSATEPVKETKPAETTTGEPASTTVIESSFVHPEFQKLINAVDEPTSEFVYCRICTGEYVRLVEEKDYRYINDAAPLYEQTQDTYCLTINPETKEEVLFKLLDDAEKGTEELRLYGQLCRLYPDLTEAEYEEKTHNGYVYGRPFRLTNLDGKPTDNAYAVSDLVSVLANSNTVVEYDPAESGYRANTICLIYQDSPYSFGTSEIHYYSVDDETMETVAVLMKRYWVNESVENGGTPLADYSIEENLFTEKVMTD